MRGNGRKTGVDLGWFPERLREERELYGMSRETLAQKTGVSPETVRRWEEGVHGASALNQEAILGVLTDLKEEDMPPVVQLVPSSLTGGLDAKTTGRLIRLLAAVRPLSDGRVEDLVAVVKSRSF